MDAGNTMNVVGGVSVPKRYTLQDRSVQLIEYAKRYDSVKYFGDTRELPVLNSLSAIIGQTPNGQKALKLIEYEVDAKYGKVPKRKYSVLDNLKKLFPDDPEYLEEE